MAKVSEQQMAEYKEAFSLFDKDGDGCIKTTEVGTVLRALGKSPTEAEVKALVKDVDPDNRGVIDFQEFMSVVSRDVRTSDNEADVRAAWKVFDKEQRGWINMSELRHVLTSVGERLSPEEIEDLTREADPENTGKVLFEPFVKVMMQR